MKPFYRYRLTPSSGKASGGILGLAILAGATWCVRNHTRLSTPHHRKPRLAIGHQHSGKTPWLLAAAGAGLAGVMVAGATTTRHRKPARSTRSLGSDVHLSGHIVIHRSPEDVYNFWKDFSNLPNVMSFIERVEPMEGNISHWVARIPGGTVEWDAETVDDQPGRLLAWRSLEGSDLQCWGTVFFQRHQNKQSTEVTVSFNFSPSDRPSRLVSEYMSVLERAVLNHNLRQLKSTLEAGHKSH